MVTEIDRAGEAEYVAVNFKVEIRAMATRGRALKTLLLHRRCASCWGTLIQKPDQGFGIEAKDHLKEIARHCSMSPDFIHPNLPVSEAIFRILISTRGQSATLGSIHMALSKRWSNPTNPQMPSIQTLYRILSRDHFYGIIETSV